MEKTLNQKTVNVKISRRELCDIILVCGIIASEADNPEGKWQVLHDKLDGILRDFDAAQGS